jgi:hypothetical protein
MQRARLRLGCALVTTIALLAVPTVSHAASRTAKDPAAIITTRHKVLRNIAPSPDFFSVCATKGQNDPGCIRAELAAIRNARGDERMKRHAMTLPNNYRSLSVAEQTFVVTNLERVDRGRPPIAGLTSKLNLLSHLAATLDRDPIITIALARVIGVTNYRSVWANDLGPLASDYDWMYDDGYSGIDSINRACLRPHEKGCWGHRANILMTFPAGLTLSGGAGTSHPLGASIAEIVACGHRKPHYTYTWAQALAHGANGHRVTAR